MLSKKEAKDIQSLSQKKFRDELKLFVAEGPKIVTELVELIPGQIEKVYATEEWIKENRKISEMVPLVSITTGDLERVSLLQTPNQAVAVIKHLPVRKPESDGFILYLDGIQDPGNFGTIIRLADWFGIHDVVCSTGCADRYNPKVVQSTMASIARVNIYNDLQDDWLKQAKLPVYAATLHGKSLYDYSKAPNGILIIGNESKGIRPDNISLADHEITIPRKGGAESLNAAVATGIILSHLIPN